MSEKETQEKETECQVESTTQSIVSKAQELEKFKSEPKPKRRWKKIVFWTIFIVVNAGAITFTMLSDFLGGGDNIYTSAMGELLSQNWWWFLIAIASMFLWFLCMTLSFCVTTKFFTGKPRLALSASTIMIGQFYSKVTPLGAGAQPFQVHHMQRKKIEDGPAITLPIMEYAVSQFAFALISVIAIILNATNVFGSTITMNIGIYIAAAIGVALNAGLPLLIIISMFSKKACSGITRFVARTAKFLRLTKDPDRMYDRVMIKLEKNSECLKLLIKRKRLILCFLLSIGSKLALASVGFFVLKAFGFQAEHSWGWAEIVVLNLLITNAVSFIPTPGNSGAIDLSFYWVYSVALLATTGVASGALATLIWRIIVFYIPIVIGFTHIMIINHRFKRKELISNRSPEGTLV
ncbi:MAG: flippase-like domain-containing protein [Firmicutes bacterium]|nr:flippase-like domain-containing protein [Bacillota bacterium]